MLACVRACHHVVFRFRYDRKQGNGFWGNSKSVIEKRPSLDASSVVSAGFQASLLQYDACELAQAWGLFARAAAAAVRQGPAGRAALRGSTFELDLLDLTRQALSNHAQVLYLRFVSQLQDRALSRGARASALRGSMAEFLQLLSDLDALLCMSPYFSFRRWEREARARTRTTPTRARALPAWTRGTHTHTHALGARCRRRVPWPRPATSGSVRSTRTALGYCGFWGGGLGRASCGLHIRGLKTQTAACRYETPFLQLPDDLPSPSCPPSLRA